MVVVVPNAPIVMSHISATGDPIHFVFRSTVYGQVFTFGGSNGARMAAGRHLGKLQRHRAVPLRQHGFLVVSLLWPLCTTELYVQER